jgi:hypothetical protein
MMEMARDTEDRGRACFSTLPRFCSMILVEESSSFIVASLRGCALLTGGCQLLQGHRSRGRLRVGVAQTED